MAADGLRLTIQLLQDINTTVETVTLEGVTYQIRYFPDTYPGTLETAYLPGILVFIDDLTVDPIVKTESFNARMVCYLGNTAEGIYDDLLQAGLLFAQRLIELYGDLIAAGSGHVLDYGTETGYRIEITGEPFTATGIRSDYQYTKEEVYYWGFSLSLPMQLTWGIEC